MLWHFHRWRFETPAMEAEFQAQMDATSRRTFNVCCTFMFLLGAIMLTLRCTLMARTTAAMTLPYLLVMGLALALIVVSRCVPVVQRGLPTLLPLAATAVIGITAWSVHGMVAQGMATAADLSLARTLALVQGHADAETELLGFVRVQLSIKSWYHVMLIMFMMADSLRLTGSRSLYVHLVPIIAMVLTTYCSEEVAERSIFTIGMAVVFAAYTTSSSIHTLLTFRDAFRSDYRLRQRLAQEAEAMKVSKEEEVAQRQASQKADTMLNHILKNIMADAYGCIELCFGHGASVDVDRHLRRAQESLQRGMRWCKKRHVMVQVNSGNYSPHLEPTGLRQLISGLIYGRDILIDIPYLTVKLDALLCEVVLDNAINNAIRHGDTDMGPVSLVVTANHHKEHTLTFTVTNFVSGSHLHPELVAQLMAGHTVTGQPGVSALSDHLGLRHMFMAAAAHRMTASLEQVGNQVIFAASLHVDLDATDPSTVATAPVPPAPPAAAPFPRGLRIYCLDDSEIARRVLLHALAAHAPQALSEAYGASEVEVAAFETAALRGADVLILDQHLDYRRGTLYGTDIAQRLRREGYTGLICIRSANATREDEVVYLQSGADCMIGKDVPLRTLVHELQAAYAHHVLLCRNQQHTTSYSPSCEESLASTTASGCLAPPPGVPGIAVFRGAPGFGTVDDRQPFFDGIRDAPRRSRPPPSTICQSIASPL